MHNQPDCVCDSKHPNPSVKGLIPDKKLLNILINDDIYGIIKGRIFIYWANWIIDGHAIISSIILQDLNNKAF